MSINKKKFGISDIIPHADISKDVNKIIQNLKTGEIPTTYINTPKLMLFGIARHIFIWEVLAFVFFYQIFIFVSVTVLITRIIPLYILFTRVWRRFYSVWSLHILALLSAVPCYFIGLLVRFLAYKFIFH